MVQDFLQHWVPGVSLLTWPRRCRAPSVVGPRGVKTHDGRQDIQDPHLWPRETRGFTWDFQGSWTFFHGDFWGVDGIFHGDFEKNKTNVFWWCDFLHEIWWIFTSGFYGSGTMGLTWGFCRRVRPSTSTMSEPHHVTSIWGFRGLSIKVPPSGWFLLGKINTQMDDD